MQAEGGNNRKLQAEALAVGYKNRIVVDGISFEVKPGEILVLIGPNGAGKSTILKTISQRLAAKGGVVSIGDKYLSDMPEKELAREMSLVMTGHPKTEYMSVRDMVSTGRYPYTGKLGILSEEDQRIVDETIANTDLCKLEDEDFNQLSDGQKQRVMLARAICQEPFILVMDEPTSFLDIHHKLELLAILKKLVRDRNIAVIMSLHELDLAQKCADACLCIAEGKVSRYGANEEIFSDPGYINDLYKVKNGSFNELYGSLELEKVNGKCKVFVIGGGGNAIPVYRRLQREGIPFAAGVIHENDVEYPIASQLGTVVAQAAFERIGEEQLKAAKAIIDTCDKVVCAVNYFGEMNAGNRTLVEYARALGKLDE